MIERIFIPDFIDENMSYNKYAEHRDRTSLGKLRSKYWTTKQLVIKKLGREEDEFVIASDADVDAKLELLYAIKRSCNELTNVCSIGVFPLSLSLFLFIHHWYHFLDLDYGTVSE